jgi:integrase
MSKERKPLTKARIEKTCAELKASRLAAGTSSDEEIVLWDSVVSGYRARCRADSATLDYRYRSRGGGRKVNPRAIKLGSYPGLDVEAGRATARIYAGEVAQGKDPAKQRAEERRRSRAGLGKLLAEDGPYELHLKERGLVNIKPALSSLRRGLKAHMAADVGEVTRNDIVTAIGELTKFGKRGAAGDLRKYSRTFLEWTVEQGLVQFNVMAGLRAPSRTRHQRLQAAEPKGRALSDAELVKVWGAAQAMQECAARGEPVSGAFGGLVQLALLTGMRRGELSQLERDRHILTGDRAADKRGITGERIHLAKAITKTAADHDIPLTPLMRAVIAAQPRTTSPLLFPSRITGDRLKGWTKLVKQLQDASGIDVEMHDLRRTVRTLMSRLGVPEDIGELSIGHQREDLLSRYNKDQAWPARIEAFEKISAHISALLAEAADDCGNVVPIHGAGRMQAT